MEKTVCQIKVRLYGGLGNQLFQYYAGRYFALQSGSQLVLDDTFNQRINTHTNSDIRQLLPSTSQYFDSNGKGFKSRDAADRFMTLISRKYQTSARISGIVPENLVVDYNLPFIKQKLSLRGYFQDDYYFDYLLSKGIESVPSLINLSQADQENILNLGMEDFVSVHVRGGDYLKLDSEMHCLDSDYYERAIAKVKDVFPGIQCVVFSNDYSYARNVIPKKLGVKYFETNSFSPSVQLILQSRALAHVISNSTYSFWSAKFATNQPLVFAPGKWFKQSELESPKIYPADWNLIPI